MFDVNKARRPHKKYNMSKILEKLINRKRRHNRVRSCISGTPECPRLSFYRSNKQVYAQLIDDVASNTIVGLSSLKSSGKGSVAKAYEMGLEIANRAKDKGITKVVFDRGGFMYTGSVKAFADAAREGGLHF